MNTSQGDNLRSCTTLNAGMMDVNRQLGGVDVSTLDEQIRVARYALVETLKICSINHMALGWSIAPSFAEAATAELEAMQQNFGLNAGMAPPPVEGLRGESDLFHLHFTLYISHIYIYTIKVYIYIY